MLLIGTILLGKSSLFNISKIVVSKTSCYSDRDIIRASGIIEGVNGFKNIGGDLNKLFTLRLGQAEDNILANCSFVKSAIVRLKLPNKIVINIEEREPFILVPYIGAYLVIDRYKYVLETVEDILKYPIPLVKGLKFTSYRIGQAVNIESNKKFEKLLNLIDALTEEEKNDNFKLMNLIDLIDIENIDNICIFLDSRLVINIGDIYDLNYKIKTIDYIFSNNIGKDDKGMLDFTAGDYPIFMPTD